MRLFLIISVSLVSMITLSSGLCAHKRCAEKREEPSSQGKDATVPVYDAANDHFEEPKEKPIPESRVRAAVRKGCRYMVNWVQGKVRGRKNKSDEKDDVHVSKRGLSFIGWARKRLQEARIFVKDVVNGLIDCGKKDTCVALECPKRVTEAIEQYTPNTVHVDITIRTLDVLHADTDATVYIILHGGEEGEETTDRIELKGAGPVFGRGKIDKFHIALDNPVNPITAVEVSRDNSGKAPGWKLDYVEVYNPETGIAQHFPFHNWLRKTEILTKETISYKPEVVEKSEKHPEAPEKKEKPKKSEKPEKSEKP